MSAGARMARLVVLVSLGGRSLAAGEAVTPAGPSDAKPAAAGDARPSPARNATPTAASEVRSSESAGTNAAAAGDARPSATHVEAESSKTARTPSVHVTVDPPTGRIGDRIRVTAAIDGSEPWMAEPSESLKPGEKLGAFHIVDLDVSRAGTIVLGLTPDEAGTLEIPGFEAVFRMSGKEDLRLAVPAAKVVIASLLGEGDATLADIKPPVDLPVPWPWREIGLGALGAAIVAAIAIAVRRWLRKPARPAVRPEEELPPGMTADAWARGELEALLAKNLREAGRHREFHIELADLVRRYLELRFRIPALERTTEEVDGEMRRALLPEDATNLTVHVLGRCDRVKFAKHLPPRDESDGTVSLVRELIDRTAPVPAAAMAEAPRETEGTAA